ncbi:MAG: cytochrome C [bacterium]|nr:MAG: cytochrome C [bacterium]
MNPRIFSFAVVVLALGLFLAFAGPVHAQGCVTDTCHQNMGKAKFVHGPVGVGQCEVCHTSGKPGHPTKAVKGDFKLPAEGKELCYLCHEPKDAGAVVHGPIAKGGCIPCHDPHQSNTEKQLKKETTSQLCFDCHENNKTTKKVVHGPVAAGDCNICHNPHSSDFKGLVELEGSDLCFLCHLDRQAQFELRYKHQPAAESCAKCHNPHATDYSYMLLAEGEALCFTCHKEMDQHLKDSQVKHSALEQKICTVCHTAHASDYPRQLKSSAKDICYTCHKDLGLQVRKASRIHGPVQQDDCYACHDPHGSANTKILKKRFPAQFYMPYATENYAICFDCHNRDIALDRFTTTLTGFRNGDQNMHYLHVNREKGRSCKACHEVHAGEQAKHIRKEVPFGKMWMLPVNYTQTKNGGSCNVGCHKPKEYDRVKPVTY